MGTSSQELTETACPAELLTLDAPVTYKYTPTGNGALLDRTGCRMDFSQNSILRIWAKEK